MKKYNLSEIMKNAWSNFHQSEKTFSECLHEAWVMAKMLILGRLWEKYGKRRIYFNQAALLNLCGVEVDSYKSGHVSYCAVNGERASHSDGEYWLDGTDGCYYDLITGKFSKNASLYASSRRSKFADVVSAIKTFARI